MDNQTKTKESCIAVTSANRTAWIETSPQIWSKSEQGLTWKDPILLAARMLFDQPRWLHASFLYDATGSELFQEITTLPEYYLTRLESEILSVHSEAIMDKADCGWLVELGAGYSVKSQYLLGQLRAAKKEPAFTPIDVSRSALEQARDRTRRDFPEVDFCGLHATYEQGLKDLSSVRGKLVAFLGSSIGNLLRTDLFAFLEELSASLQPGDGFLLGVDEIKDPAVVEAAYDDSRGVTRRFILNVLSHLNRQIGTDFDPARFIYRPRYNPDWHQMEMYLEAADRHEVSFPEPWDPLVWEEGEKLLVEVSRKFRSRLLAQQLISYGLELVEAYSDRRQWFSVLLFRKTKSTA